MLPLAACGGSDSGDVSDDGASSDIDRELVVGITEDLTGANPLQRPSSLIFGVLSNVFDSHVGQDPETQEMVPQIFTSWEPNADATEWTIQIRDDVTFHNGEELTADDVKFTLDFILSPEMGGHEINIFWNTVQEIEVVGDYELVLRTATSTPGLIETSELAILPKDYIEEVGWDGFDEAPIGSGPYKWVEWRAGEHLVLEANEDYWGGAPEIKDLRFRVITDEAAMGASYQAGEVHVAQNIPLELYRSLENDPELGVGTSSSARHYILLDTTRPPFDDVRVRQALNHAIDWDTIIEELLAGLVERTPAILGSAERGFNPDLEPYEYDPERARELLGEAGYPDGVDVEYWARKGVFQIEQVAPAILPYLEEAGFRATLSVKERGDVEDLAEERTLAQMVSTNWGINQQLIGMEIYQTRFTCNEETMSNTWGGWYCNPRYDELAAEAIAQWIDDPEAVDAKTREMEAILQEDAGVGFAYMIPRLYGLVKSLDWILTPTQNLNFARARWLS
ncbi:ABC transporter substrate-binding protein [Jiangella ureilytica]|nr:ABC transporter substrate-binding protein [Jiangella ureilytica]